MDNYNNNKKQLIDLSLRCTNYKSWIDIITITGGSGGSQSVVLIGKVDDIKIVLKCTPLRKKREFMKEIPNRDLVEIDIYKYISRKYLDTSITPHFVGIYQHRKCNDIKKFFKEKCPTLQELLTNKKIAEKKKKICDFNDRLRWFQKTLHLLLLEYCPLKIDSEFEQLLIRYKQKRVNIEELTEFLYRVIFQILYTLAHIQKKEKQFYHGDLFLRNILGVNECSKNINDYVEYIYNNKKFYFPANGFYTKISDFGTTIILPMHMANTLSKKDDFYNDNKTDVFAFLHDMYDGQNLGATSLIKLARDNKMIKKDITNLRNIFKKFLDVNMIDKMNRINKKKLDRTWHIKEHSFLRKLVKEPRQYLSSNVFSRYNKLPKNGRVIKTFGVNNNKSGGTRSSNERSGDYNKYIKYKAKYLLLKNHSA